MPGSRVGLVADDQRLAGAIQAHLKRNVNPVSVVNYRFETIRHYLWRDIDGLLLMVAANAAECEQIQRLVQEVYLQKLPQVLLISEGDTLPLQTHLDRLDPYVVNRLRWPDDAERLAALVRERLPRGHPI